MEALDGLYFNEIYDNINTTTSKPNVSRRLNNLMEDGIVIARPAENHKKGKKYYFYNPLIKFIVLNRGKNITDKDILYEVARLGKKALPFIEHYAQWINEQQKNLDYEVLLNE